ncbi:type IV pilin N-terminal domain-containing protein [Halobaculum marinum]|nr:type IV pilin N-terminal domain-containing protein [Halobaculum sp. DT55]
MVAIAVLLAAVLGAAMLGFSGGLGAGPPALSVEFTYIQDGNEYEVVATIYGGQTITKQNTENVTLVAESGQQETALKTRYPLTGGDDIIVKGVPPGTNVRLVWTGPDGGSGVVARGRTPF